MKAMRLARMLVPTDFSAGATAAAHVAAEMGTRLGMGVDILTVVDTSPFADAYGDPSFRTGCIAEIQRKAGEEAAAFGERHFAGINDVHVHVRDGDAFLEIMNAAQDLGSDLIVMGTHGRTGLAHLFIGSVAEKVVRKSPVPVLTVRGNT
jgi:nucleotide-binding universal stress UspA family protein